jgi:hypothetical protein
MLVATLISLFSSALVVVEGDAAVAADRAPHGGDASRLVLGTVACSAVFSTLLVVLTFWCAAVLP